MPTWLVPTLKWGGIAVPIIAAIAIIYMQFVPGAPAPEAGVTPGGTPVSLYWVLLLIGVVAAVAGFMMERRRKPT